MGWFEKKQDFEQELVAAKIESEAPKNPAEEWVWVSGYKGTDKDMQCHNYQYEMNKQHDMPEDVEIVACLRGFHLCLYLNDVFRYYDVMYNNRFFEVRALVRKDDVKNYSYETGRKLVSKSIIFTRELTVDEILNARVTTVRPADRVILNMENWTDDEKQKCLNVGFSAMCDLMCINKLVELGYSHPFARYVYNNGAYDVALSVGSQKDLSMDMKGLFIHDDIQRRYADRERRRNDRAWHREVSF